MSQRRSCVWVGFYRVLGHIQVGLVELCTSFLLYCRSRLVSKDICLQGSEWGYILEGFC